MDREYFFKKIQLIGLSLFFMGIYKKEIFCLSTGLNE